MEGVYINIPALEEKIAVYKELVDKYNLIFDNIDNTNNHIIAVGNWDSPVRRDFVKSLELLKTNGDIHYNKGKNVIDMLDGIVTNAKIAEASLEQTAASITSGQATSTR